jgi:hypothetical protein
VYTGHVAKSENLFCCISNLELAFVLDEVGAGHEEWAHAVLEDVGLEGCPSIAKEGFPHEDSLKGQPWESLKGLIVAERNKWN